MYLSRAEDLIDFWGRELSGEGPPAPHRGASTGMSPAEIAAAFGGRVKAGGPRGR